MIIKNKYRIFVFSTLSLITSQVSFAVDSIEDELKRNFEAKTRPAAKLLINTAQIVLDRKIQLGYNEDLYASEKGPRIEYDLNLDGPGKRQAYNYVLLPKRLRNRIDREGPLTPEDLEKLEKSTSFQNALRSYRQVGETYAKARQLIEKDPIVAAKVKDLNSQLQMERNEMEKQTITAVKALSEAAEAVLGRKIQLGYNEDLYASEKGPRIEYDLNLDGLGKRQAYNYALLPERLQNRIDREGPLSPSDLDKLEESPSFQNALRTYRQVATNYIQATTALHKEGREVIETALGTAVFSSRANFSPDLELIDPLTKRNHEVQVTCPR